MLRKGYRFHVDGRKRFEYAKCGWVAFFLENGEKDLRFQKNPDTCPYSSSLNPLRVLRVGVISGSVVPGVPAGRNQKFHY